MARMRAVLPVVMVVLLGGSAGAARRPYLNLYDAGMVPEGDVEIESWLDFISNRSGYASDEWRWWIGPRWSPAEGLEVASLLVLTQPLTSPSAGGSTTQLWADLVEARWRMLQMGSATVIAHLDLRIALANDLPHQLAPSIEVAHRLGPIDLAAQFGYAVGFEGPGAGYQWIVWRAGAAVDVIKGAISPPLQLGVEGFGEWVLDGRNELTDATASTANVGPTLSVARGRLWLTIGSLVGLTDASPALFTRAIIGVAL